MRDTSRALAVATLVITLTVVAALLPDSLRLPPQGPLAPPPDSACADRPYSWARSDTTVLPPFGDMAARGNEAFSGDSVRLTNVSFRPGDPAQIVWGGVLTNGTQSVIEIRGYLLTFLSATGDVVSTKTCRISMGAEQCGVHSTNLKRVGGVSLIADTLHGAPATADRDTAQIFWSYCRAASGAR